MELVSAVDAVALLLVLDPSGIVKSSNDKFLRLIGRTQNDTVGVSYQLLLSEECVQTVYGTALETALRGLTWAGEFEHKSRAGSSVWTSSHLVPSLDEAGNLQSIQVVGFEITERRAVESALAASESFQKALMEVAPVGVFLANADGECLYINSKWNELTGLRLRAAIGNGWLEAIHDGDRARVAKAWAEFVQHQVPFSCEYRYESEGGQIRWVLAVATEIRNMPGRQFAYLRIEQDLTAHKENQRVIDEQRAKMLASSKLSALGEMAGGIAHEINNPLSIILGKVDILKDRLAEGGAEPVWVNGTIESIQNTCIRIAKIVKALRSVSRDGGADLFERGDLRTIFEETLDLCSSRFNKGHVRLKRGAIPLGLAIECRPVQIAQLLLNLLNNAHDAVSGPDCREKWVGVDFVEHADHIEISVIDGGPGVRAEIREKIFDPFFTTKPAGAGTGLGLSVSESIVRSHGGKIYLDSASEWTRFVVKLPKKRPVTRGEYRNAV